MTPDPHLYIRNMQLMCHYSAHMRTPEKLVESQHTFLTQYWKAYKPREDYNNWGIFLRGMKRVIDSCVAEPQIIKEPTLGEFWRAFAASFRALVGACAMELRKRLLGSRREDSRDLEPNQ